MRFKIFILLNSLQVIFGLSGLSQLNAYQHPGNITDKHTVYSYKKSNWDGSHASTIYLYVADSNRLESFKWAKGEAVATLVTAEIDWNIFSVKSFINHRLRHGQSPSLVAELKMKSNKTISIEVGEMRDSLEIAGFPWQSYDFDFAGLSFTWRALKNKLDTFYFHVADAARINGNMAFVNKGRVYVKSRGVELLDGITCLKYSIDGPGLENKGGIIWVNAESQMIEQYQIELPDEEGFVNGMLQLIKIEKMQPKEWEAFKLKCLANN